MQAFFRTFARYLLPILLPLYLAFVKETTAVVNDDGGGRSHLINLSATVETFFFKDNSIAQNWKKKKKTYQRICQQLIVVYKELCNQRNIKLLHHGFLEKFSCTNQLTQFWSFWQVAQKPVEFLSSPELHCFPPHRFQLKIGMLIMLLQKHNPAQWCN